MFKPEYQDEVIFQHDVLKIARGDEILVAFARCHNEESQLANMFPEFLACDFTFGVTNEQKK